MKQESKMKTANTCKIIGLVLLACMLAIGGCIEKKSEYTINPDGSGKVLYDVIFAPMNLNLTGDDTDPAGQVKDAVEKILNESKGVDTWKDVSFELTDDGKVHFNGTAYFADFNNLDIKAGGFSSKQELVLSKDSVGRIAIELKDTSDPKDDEKKTDAENLTEEQVAQKIKEARLQYNTAKPMVIGMLGTLKTDTTLHLPGTIAEVSNFEKIDGSTVRLVFEGAKILEVMDKMMQDDEMLEEQIRAGKNPMQSGPGSDLIANKMLYGQEAPVKVVLTGKTKNLFDYKTEVQAAKDNYKNMIKELGFGETSPLSVDKVSETAAEPGSVTVGGVRLIRYTDKERKIRPFNYDEGYTLSLIVELPEPALTISESQMKKAIDDTGADLLPEKDWDRRIHFAKLSEDKKAALFEINLKVPDEKASRMTELSGEFEYFTSAGSKEIDLGQMDFKDGAESVIEGFSIKSIKVESWNTEYTVMNLKVDLLKDSIKTVKLYDADGNELEISKGGSMSSSGRLMSIGYKIKDKFPEKGRIVFEVFDNLVKHKLDFKLENISLLGVSLE